MPEIAPRVPARLTRSIASAQGRRDYLRVRLTPLAQTAPNSGDALCPLFEADPLTGTSGIITGMTAADGLLVCPENREGFNAGDTVMVEMFQ